MSGRYSGNGRIAGVRRAAPPRIALAVVVALAALGGCTSGTTGGTVGVTLQEWAVLPEKDSVPAGKVTFQAKNSGPDDRHELVVIKTDLAPDALPANADGKVQEDAAGIEMIGEIEEFDPGKTETAVFDLKPGKYVLICNIVEDKGSSKESHYMLGMRVPFTVR